MSKFMQKYIEENFGEQVPIKNRFFNIVVIGAIIFSILATIVNLITGVGTAGYLACFFCVFCAFALVPASRYIKNVDGLIYAAIIALNFVVFPLLYFTLGAIDSGMPLFFVLGIVFTMLMVDSIKLDIILVALELICYTAIMHVDKLHPEIAAKFFVMGDRVYLDTGMDLVVVSLCIGILVKILSDSFKKQQAKTDQLLAQMEELAVKDPLTGAYNRRFLMKYLETSIANARGNSKNMAIVMFDIDKFKRINDDYGHLTGDEVIKALATTLMKCCRDYDIVSRYGGEEFVLVLPGANEETAILRAETVRQTFADLKVSDTIDRPVTISGGVAEIKPNIKNPEDFISLADNNLYIAKETGRNKIVGTTYNKNT